MKNISSQIALLFCVFLSTGLMAQVPQNTKNGADHNLRSSARVNPSTLAMELSIPLMSYPGRAGNSVPLALSYSSKIWTMKHRRWLEPSVTFTVNGTGNGSQQNPNMIYHITEIDALFGQDTAAGWTVPGLQPIVFDFEDREMRMKDNGVNQLYFIDRVRVTLPNGSSHELRKIDKSIHCNQYPNECTDMSVSGTYLSVDGTGMRAEMSGTPTIYMPNGGKYILNGYDYVYLDRNGNKTTYDHSTRTLTDTMGRQISNPFYPANSTFTLPGFDSGTLTYAQTWEALKPTGCDTGYETACANAALENPTDQLYYLGNDTCVSETVDTPVPTPRLFEVYPPEDNCYSTGGGQNGNIYWCEVSKQRMCTANARFNPSVLTELTFPDGRKYKFRYNRYGEMTKIIYPTGAYERFLYAELPMTGDYPFSQTGRGVVERWLSTDGTTEDQHWTYTKGFVTATNSSIITTINPDGSKTESLSHLAGDLGLGFENTRAGMIFDQRIYSQPTTPGNESTRVLMQRTLTDWIVAPARAGGYMTRDARPAKQISVVYEQGNASALATMTETTYDDQTDQEYFAHLNAKQIKKYDYVAISTSTASNTYLVAADAAVWFSGQSPVVVTESDYLYDSNYKARSINGLATETRIEDANGNAKAKTQITYDNFRTYSLIRGDRSDYWKDPESDYRGLATATKSWSDITNNSYVETQAQYDQLGNLRNSWDGRGNLSQVEYSLDYDYAYPTKTISPVPDSNGTYGLNAELESTMTYDFNTGLPLTTTDPNGAVTAMEYVDPLLRPTKVTAPNGHQTITEYGAGTSADTRWVKARSQIDATNWKEGLSWFDGLGRTIRSQSVDAESGDVFTMTCYDAVGRPSKVTNPFRGYTNQTCATTTGLEWTTKTYDTAGRPWKVTTPDGAEVETTYGLASTSGYLLGSVVTVEDQAGKLRRSVTNALGQLKRVDEPNSSNALGALTAPNQDTTYAYDYLSNLTTVTQGAQTRTFTYDALSRLKTAVNPESGTINYTYDANSNLATKTDARSITTTYSYDRLNRVYSRNYSDSTPDVSYYYDNLTNAKGKLIKVASSVSTTEYTSFDILGRVTGHKQTTDGNDYTTGYTYKLGGALTEQTYPSGRVVKNELDASGDLSSVTSKENSSAIFKTYANDFAYNAAGAVTSLRLGNGRFESTTFNSRLQPTQIGLGTSETNQNILKLEYGYGTTANNGNVQTQTITVPGMAHSLIQNYTYDSLNRLESAIETSNSTQTWKQEFSYDRYGNRNFVTGTGHTTTLGSCTTMCNPTFSSTTNRITSSGFSYDSGGNTTADSDGRSFTYDAENKQTQVSNGSGAIGNYYYDGDGKRVKKYVPGTGETTVFVYDAGGKQIAEYSTIVADASTAKVAYLTADHLGSPRINTDVTGAVTSRHDYHPFGEEIATAQRTSGLGYADDTIRIQFTGYERDGETDLDFAQARFFASNYGRFQSPDEPLFDQWEGKPQTWNLYVYALNNPLRITDPTGAWHVDENGNVIGDYDGEYSEEMDAFWVEDGGYWEFGGDHTAPDIEEERDAICVNGDCFFVQRFEPDIPGGGIVRQGGRQAAKRFGPGIGNFFKRNASKTWKFARKKLGFLDDVSYKTADDVIDAATNATTVGNGQIQKELKGNLDDIFDELASEAGATVLTAKNGQKYFRNGSTRIGKHDSTTPGHVGTPTLDINQAGKIYKIRITP